MAAKKPTKKALAEAGAAAPADSKSRAGDESFLEWKINAPFLDNQLERRPFEFSEDEWKFLRSHAASWMDGLEKGRSIHAIEVLRLCSGFLRAGYAPPDPVGTWLAQRLDAIAAEDSPWGVPLLKRGKNSKSADNWHIEIVVASYYNRLLENGVKQEAARLETVEALHLLAEDLTPDKVHNYWRKNYRVRDGM